MVPAGDDLEVGVHWFRAVVKDTPAVDVVIKLGELLGESAELRDGAPHRYDSTAVLGPVKVWWHEQRPEMGVCVEVMGSACEQLGVQGLLRIWDAFDWRASRIDVAVDGVPFTPEQVMQAWRAGDVRTRVKVARDAREDRQWRTSEWGSNSQGDIFLMGSRLSTGYMRCYDRRGPTRLEHEMKGDLAATVAGQVMESLRASDRDSAPFAQLVLGMIRRFMDFVDRASDSNASRCRLLGWWQAFIGGFEKARVWLGQRQVKQVSEVLDWMVRQVGPSLGVLLQVFGAHVVLSLARDGQSRWKRRHRDTLRESGYYPAAI